MFVLFDASQLTGKRMVSFLCLGLLMSTVPLSAAPYKQGDISLKPLNLYIFSRGTGFGRKDSKIDSNEVDAFKGSRTFGFNDAERNGIGYSFELAYMFTPQIEIFLTPQFIYESPQSKIASDTGAFLPGPPAGFAIQRAFDFESRFTFGASVGGRYYFDLENSPWVPHLGGSIGVLRQGETRATSFTRLPFLAGFVPLAPAQQFQPARTILTAAIIGGVDYRFNETYAVTFATGVYYTQRPSQTTTTVAGNPLTYQNNLPQFSIPVVASFKITF